MALTRESIYSSVDALPEPLEPTRVRKVPTGIADLDSIVDGGFPSGSTILLLGDVGAGMQEYVYTASAKTSLVNERPQARHYYLGDHCDHSELPHQVCYVTFSRSKEIILQELATSFNGDYYRAFRDHTVLRDFSSMYFEKFTGVLPHLPRDKIARFPTMVSSNNGLVVVFMERIS